MMEDDGLGLSLGIKSFEKKPSQTPRPAPVPPVLTPPLKDSSSICRLGGTNATRLNLGWMSGKPKPRHSHKGLDRDISKFLGSSSELSMSMAAGKRSAEREVIICDEEDGGDVDQRGDIRAGVAVGGREGGPEKKKLRLSKEQSSLLERTFLEHSTLNNKQKMYLAKELKLKPRQVEVWFQNRRARTKLKQTEVDCEFLREYCKRLSEENRRLHKELQQLNSASGLGLCHACNRGSSAADAGRPRRSLAPSIRPVDHDRPNVSGFFFNKGSLLKI